MEPDKNHGNWISKADQKLSKSGWRVLFFLVAFWGLVFVGVWGFWTLLPAIKAPSFQSLDVLYEEERLRFDDEELYNRLQAWLKEKPVDRQVQEAVHKRLNDLETPEDLMQAGVLDKHELAWIAEQSALKWAILEAKQKALAKELDDSFKPDWKCSWDPDRDLSSCLQIFQLVPPWEDLEYLRGGETGISN